MPFKFDQKVCVIYRERLVRSKVAHRTCHHVFHKDCLNDYYWCMFNDGHVFVCCPTCQGDTLEDREAYRLAYCKMWRNERRIERQILMYRLRKEARKMREEADGLMKKYEWDPYEKTWKENEEPVQIDRIWVAIVNNKKEDNKSYCLE